MKFLLLLSLVSFNMREYPATLVDCYDGDTCTFNVEIFDSVTYKAKVRLCDIDTPEMKGDTKEQAIIARDHLLFLMRDKNINLLFAMNTNDNYQKSFDRYLAYVLVDRKDIGRVMVDDGFAVWSDKKCVK